MTTMGDALTSSSPRSRISASTRVYGVIGDPVRHSLSPVIHNAAFAAAGLDAVYVAFPVAAGEGRAAVRAMGVLGIDGLNVTMPHKSDAAAACDVLTPDAARLGVANTVARLPDGRLLGDSTDGEGFVRSLEEAGVYVQDRRVLLLGAGGAARSVALALGRRRATLIVAARRPDAAREILELTGRGEAIAFDEAGRHTLGVDIIVNSTPIGMGAAGPIEQPLPLPRDSLQRSHVVVDLVYHPLETPLLAAARATGATVVDGLGMLVHQAALAFTGWTSAPAPVAAMRAAARAVVVGRSGQG